LHPKRGEVAGGQTVATSDIEIMATRLKVEERDDGGPAKDIQDVYKKPYTFL